MVFAKLFGAKLAPQQSTINVLYAAIVAAARQPKFYAEMKVADTVDGRFDLVVLHLSLLLARLPKTQQDLRQGLIDVFCADMDANLREIGVGDISVGKKVRRMAEAFQGRYEAYAEAEDVAALEQALWRNVYRSAPEASAKQLAAHVHKLRANLAAQSDEDLAAGKVVLS